MAIMLMERLIARLKVEEGWSSYAYIDTTGHLTIGYGHNLGSILPVSVRFTPINGISKAVGEAILISDALDCLSGLRHAYPAYLDLDETRGIVVADMAFNLGVEGLMKWPIFLSQIKESRFQDAAENMRHTPWYKQVGGRGESLALMMETGEEHRARTMPHRLHLKGTAV